MRNNLMLLGIDLGNTCDLLWKIYNAYYDPVNRLSYFMEWMIYLYCESDGMWNENMKCKLWNKRERKFKETRKRA